MRLFSFFQQKTPPQSPPISSVRTKPRGKIAAPALGGSIRAEPREVADLAERMDKDYQVQLARRVLAANIQSVQVNVTASGNDPRIQALADQLQGLWNCSLPSMLPAIAYGRVAFEKIFAYDQTHNLAVVKSLDPLPYRESALTLGTDGAYEGIDLTLAGSRVQIPADKSWWLALDATVLEPHGKSQYLGAPAETYRRREKTRKRFDTLMNRLSVRGFIAYHPLDEEDERGQRFDPGEVLAGQLDALTSGGHLLLPNTRHPVLNEYAYKVQETTEVLETAPLLAAIADEDAEQLRAFGIPEKTVTEGDAVGSHAMVKQQTLVLYAVVDGLLAQFTNSFQKYVVDKVVELNFDPEELPRITVRFVRLAERPDSVLAQVVTSILGSARLNPLVESGAIDLVQLLESAGIPLASNVRQRLAQIHGAPSPAQTGEGGKQIPGGQVTLQNPNVDSELRATDGRWTAGGAGTARHAAVKKKTDQESPRSYAASLNPNADEVDDRRWNRLSEGQKKDLIWNFLTMDWSRLTDPQLRRMAIECDRIEQMDPKSRSHDQELQLKAYEHKMGRDIPASKAEPPPSFGEPEPSRFAEPDKPIQEPGKGGGWNWGWDWPRGFDWGASSNQNAQPARPPASQGPDWKWPSWLSWPHWSWGGSQTERSGENRDRNRASSNGDSSGWLPRDTPELDRIRERIQTHAIVDRIENALQESGFADFVAAMERDGGTLKDYAGFLNDAGFNIDFSGLNPGLKLTDLTEAQRDALYTATVFAAQLGEGVLHLADFFASGIDETKNVAKDLTLGWDPRRAMASQLGKWSEEKSRRGLWSYYAALPGAAWEAVKEFFRGASGVNFYKGYEHWKKTGDSSRWVHGGMELLGGVKSLRSIPGNPLERITPESTAQFGKGFKQGVDKSLRRPTVGTFGGPLEHIFEGMQEGFKRARVFNPKPIEFSTAHLKGSTGLTYKIFQRNDIDWNLVRKTGPEKGLGLTNAEAASTHGLGPVLSDGSIATLHHSQQNALGPLFEASTRYHKIQNASKRPLHPYGRKQHPDHPMGKGPGSVRDPFQAVDSLEYWKWRGRQELKE